MRKIYTIDASTGCTCCSGENFEEGPYTDPDQPQAIIDRWRRGDDNPLASQYARYGRYSLREYTAEELPGGRFIIGDRVWGPEIERKQD
jgi:hypothetical protein